MSPPSPLDRQPAGSRTGGWLTVGLMSGLCGILAMVIPSVAAWIAATGVLVLARWRGWWTTRPCGEPIDGRPLLAAVALGTMVGAVQYYAGARVPGHWFERAIDYRAEAVVSLAHSDNPDVSRLVPAIISKRDGAYYIDATSLPSGPNLVFDDDTPLTWNTTAYVFSANGMLWRIELGAR